VSHIAKLMGGRETGSERDQSAVSRKETPDVSRRDSAKCLRGCIKTSITALFVRVSNTYFDGTRAFSSSNQLRTTRISGVNAPLD
jgi:hypothetical protein